MTRSPSSSGSCFVPAHASLSDRLRTDLRPFLEPATAVVLGASPRSGVAGQWVRNLTAGGCPRDRHHPANRELGGVPVVPAMGDLDHVPDIACVALGAGNAVAGVEQALAPARGTSWSRAWGRRRARGAAARARLTELCDAHDGLMVGPNGMGVIGARRAVGLDRHRAADVRPRRGRDPRPVRLVRRGAWAGMGPRVGVRGMVSSGNEAAGDAADWVAFYADDPKTQAIGADARGDPASGAFERRPARGRPRPASRSRS